MQNNDLNNFYKYIQANQINEANNEINKLLQLDPDNFLFLHCYGFILHKQNNFIEAIKIFKKSIALNEEFFENYFNISLCLINLKMKNEAIFYLKKYIDYKKDNCDVYNNLGLLYLENNQLDDATLCFNKCISINLGYVKAYNNLSFALFKKDLIDEAINVIEIGLFGREREISARSFPGTRTSPFSKISAAKFALEDVSKSEAERIT